MKHKNTLFVLTLVTSSILTGTAQATLFDLGTLGNYTLEIIPTAAGLNSYGTSIADNGSATGYTQSQAGINEAFIYSNGTMTNLGTLGGQGSISTGINIHNQVVGYSQTSTGQWDAFLWQNGVMTNIGANASWAGINNNGLIGVNTTNGSYVYNSANNTSITLQSGFDIHYVANDGTIAGDIQLVSGSYRAAFSNNDGTQVINGPYNSAITGGNNLGNYVGFANGWADVSAAYWATQTTSPVDTGIYLSNLHTTSGPSGINDNGLIAGGSAINQSDVDAYVAYAGSVYDLTNIAGFLHGCNATCLNINVSLNNKNEIYGTISSGSNNYAAILIPQSISAVPIPSAIWLFGSAVAGFIGFSRRNTKSITQHHQSTL